MLINSYIHIPYVGYITEKKIWDAGITSWHSFDPDKLNFPAFRKEHLQKYVSMSIKALEASDYSFFSRALMPHEHWRCLPDMKVAYLDIETTGLDKHHDDITIIGVYDGKQTKIFQRGREFLEFREYIKQFPMIVTFNGSCFDLPFISSKLGIHFDQLHFDLRFAFHRLGIGGGLKHIETVYGIRRSQETKGMDGLDAVRLWHRYVHGDDAALELLKKYNSEDIVNLKTLAEKAYEALRKKTMCYNRE
jgi:uncharacterized protein YprB with RNaseH-like and TPR domain